MLTTSYRLSITDHDVIYKAMMLQRFDWKDKYLIKVDEVDFQHQYFLSEINKINIFYTEGYRNVKISDILQEIINYAVFHFKSEENLMIEHEYPGLELHKKEHEDLYNKLLVHSVNIDGQEENLEDLYEFLVDWFVEHTTKEDQEFGKFYNLL